MEIAKKKEAWFEYYAQSSETYREKREKACSKRQKTQIIDHISALAHAYDHFNLLGPYLQYEQTPSTVLPCAGGSWKYSPKQIINRFPLGLRDYCGLFTDSSVNRLHAMISTYPETQRLSEGSLSLLYTCNYLLLIIFYLAKQLALEIAYSLVVQLHFD